jgi:alpha-amylase/alpha-mannosidase (GH57 family)
MPEKYFCVHGHFYQPPRVDPFTGEIPQEFGAEPYSNWTEKIYHTCYLPNAQIGNFEKISFNLGSTLSHWLEQYHLDTLKEIVRQENVVKTRLGVSNGMAQTYFHIIMPLANHRDKLTMVRWGLHDYERLFGHRPQGMWLPETAVDLETLDVMAQEGVQFTILAPWQAKRSDLDITHPYRIELPSGKSIAVFFYNSFLSGEISFDPQSTENADRFVQDWLLPQMGTIQHDGAQLFLAASDGELYGHHQPFRDMFLSRLLDGAVEARGILRSYPAAWLRDHPLDQTAEILEDTSWSCHHGIERWRDVCGDAPNATWKKPLREFLTQLAQSIDDVYEEMSPKLISDPWAVRDDYAQVVMGQTTPNEFVQEHAKKI